MKGHALIGDVSREYSDNPPMAPDIPHVVVAAEPRFDFSGGEYAELFARSDATAFQHPLWLRHLFGTVAPRRDAEPCVVTGRHAEHGTLLFALPLMLRAKSGLTLLEAADLGVSDYAAPVIDRASRRTSDLSDIAGEVAAVLPSHDILRIRPVREEHLADWRLFFSAAPAACDFSAHAVALGKDYQAWRSAAYSPTFAKYLDRRKKRFLKLDGALLRRLADPSEIGKAIDSMAALREGRFDGDMIALEFVCEFYRDVAVEGAPSRLANTYVLEAAGEAVGYVFGLSHEGSFHYLLIGCDYTRHGKHSPGLLLYDAIIEDWIASGGTSFDFTIGDEPFKADFGTVPTRMFEITSGRTWRGKLALAAMGGRQRLGALMGGGDKP